MLQIPVVGSICVPILGVLLAFVDGKISLLFRLFEWALLLLEEFALFLSSSLRSSLLSRSFLSSLLSRSLSRLSLRSLLDLS